MAPKYKDRARAQVERLLHNTMTRDTVNASLLMKPILLKSVVGGHFDQIKFT